LIDGWGSGLRVEARPSLEKHANFIVNDWRGTVAETRLAEVGPGDGARADGVGLRRGRLRGRLVGLE
jgi:hypothetical protein